MKKALCEAFCENLSVHEVPAGLAVGTSFRRNNGDKIGFYIVYENKLHISARIEDDGLTVASLEADGVNLFNGPRSEQFSLLLRQACVVYDEQECTLRTDYMPTSKLAAASLDFMAFLIRVQELMHWTREAVEDTFKDDVIRAVKKHYEERARVYLAGEIDDVVPGSLADIVVQSASRTPLAVFIGTSEPKALEATLLWSDARASITKFANVMLVVDSPKPKRIRERTYARAMLRFPVAVFPGFQQDALAAMDRAVFEDGGSYGGRPVH